jgi:hypothetical protein
MALLNVRRFGSSFPLEGGREGMGVAALPSQDTAHEAAPPPEAFHHRSAATPIPRPSPLEGEGSALGHTVGFIGLDVPLELIDAAGLTPLQITADPGLPSPAAEPFGEGVGHPLLRALTGAVVELADAGLKRLWVGATPARDFSLFACLASLKRAGAALADLEITAADVLHGDSPADHAHNRALFARLADGLGFDDGEALRTAIARRNVIRDRLATIETHRRDGRLSGVEALAIHAEGGRSTAGAYLQRLDGLLADIASRSVLTGRKVIVSGSAETAARTYPVYEAAGLLVVGDDHDGGSRAIGPRVAEGADPLDALAERYRARTPAPSGWTTAAATTALVQLARRQGAEAVIFDVPHYDHAAAWDLPKKIAALAAAGITHTVLPPAAFRDPEAAARAAAHVLTTESRS